MPDEENNSLNVNDDDELVMSMMTSVLRDVISPAVVFQRCPLRITFTCTKWTKTASVHISYCKRQGIYFNG